jgi:hypothetical protein
MSTWHAPADTLARFATEPERLDERVASSIEQHLVRCAECRAAVAVAAPPADLERSWAAIADVVDRPRRSFVERLLGRVGVSPSMARLVSATRELRWAWLVLVGVLCAGAVALARTEGSDGPFLAAAPLVPLAAVLVGFLPIGDPAGEAGRAAPVFGLGLALRRVVAVVAPAMLVVAAGSLATPGLGVTAFVWVLPGLALAVVALAASTFVRVGTAVAVLAAAWSISMVVGSLGDRQLAASGSAAFGAGGQAAALVLAIAAAVVVARRRDRFSTLEVTW